MNKELIELFFQKKCTARQAGQVAAFLKDHPELLNKCLNEYDWDAADAHYNMPEAFWDDVWLSIEKKQRAKIIQLRLKGSMAAACVVLLIVAGYYMLRPQKQIITQQTNKQLIPAAAFQIIKNTTGKIMKVVLQDSSVITLSPSSSLRFYVPFQNNKRDVWLAGEAYFKVAKDKTKPFTVYANELATTALGTSFSIKTNSINKQVTVKLYTGKVVIHSTNNDLPGWNQDMYLTPGEQLNFNPEKLLVEVRKINNKTNTGNAVTIAKNENTNATINSNILNFSNTQLPEVIDKLASYFSVKIVYDKSLLDTMNFTGTVSKTDSVQVILKVITQMNSLQLSNNESEFIITKP